MKNACMALFFFLGLAINQLSAQSCQPCPPGCCVKACTPDGKSAAVNNKTTDVATLVAACTPAQLEACKTASPSACTAKSGNSAAVTTDVKAVTVSNTSAGAQKKTACTQPCTKKSAPLEQ